MSGINTNHLHPALSAFESLRKIQRGFEDDFKLFKAVMADSNKSLSLWEAFSTDAMMANVVAEGVAKRIDMLCESIGSPYHFGDYLEAAIDLTKSEIRQRSPEGQAGKALDKIHKRMLAILDESLRKYNSAMRIYSNSYQKAS